jgi:hypothetical protein
MVISLSFLPFSDPLYIQRNTVLHAAKRPDRMTEGDIGSILFVTVISFCGYALQLRSPHLGTSTAQVQSEGHVLGEYVLPHKTGTCHVAANVGWGQSNNVNRS